MVFTDTAQFVYSSDLYCTEQNIYIITSTKEGGPFAWAPTMYTDSLQSKRRLKKAPNNDLKDEACSPQQEQQPRPARARHHRHYCCCLIYWPVA